MSEDNQVASGSTEGCPFDHHDYAVIQDPYETWADLRERAAIHSVDLYGHFYFVPRFNDVRMALTDSRHFSVKDGSSIPLYPIKFIPLNTDPPDHRVYRRILEAAFSTEEVAKHEGWIRECARELLDRVEGTNEFDYTAAVARPLPTRVIFPLLGMSDRLEEVCEWTETLNSHAETDPEGAAEAAAKLNSYLLEFITRRREEGASDDYTSLLLDASFDGRPLNDEELLSYVSLLIFGGLHTTAGTLSEMVRWLATHPEGLDTLRSHPELIPTAVDEFLRIAHPAPYVARTVTEPVEVAGQTLCPGTRVLFGLGPANRDPGRFADPEEVQLDRSPNPHLSFGGGIHRCIGAPLAKLEIRMALEEIVERFDTLALVDAAALPYTTGGDIRVLESVRVTVQRKKTEAEK